ncbi:hypothetical protein, partial [Thalassolituus sp. UBA6592]|uniref:hypothetical protein n=1 Tax=Thalassolituus sp. UBA6592 TaxID=1947665 RepID=UPI0025F77D0C
TATYSKTAILQRFAVFLWLKLTGPDGGERRVRTLVGSHRAKRQTSGACDGVHPDRIFKVAGRDIPPLTLIGHLF